MFGGVSFAGGAYAGTDGVSITAHSGPIMAVEVSFTTDALDPPAFVDVSEDMRDWTVDRGRRRELERFQPGRATVTLDNRDGRFDSNNAAGEFFGNLRPRRRMRIRATYREATHPVFDGYLDQFHLEYPGLNDAIAVLTATDGGKMLGQRPLPRSVYAEEVEADNPVVWLRLDEPTGSATALNLGSLGSARNGTYQEPYGLQSERIVVNDPGPSMVSKGFPFEGTHDGGVDMGTFVLSAFTDWSVEFWIRHDSDAPDFDVAWGEEANLTGLDWPAACGVDGNDAGRFYFVLKNTANEMFGVSHSVTQVAGVINHVVCSLEADGQMAITVDNVRSTTLLGGGTHPVTLETVVGTVFSGTQQDGNFGIGFTHNQNLGIFGLLSNFAVYDGALAADRIEAHFDAGTAPWNGDLTDARITRILDIADWPEALRDLDAGLNTLQSADLGGQSVLEHLQKVAESEYGLTYMSRDGLVRFKSRFNHLNPPGPFKTWTDTDYRDVKYDDSDSVLRNRATISRLNGVAKTVEDAASIREFGPFQFTLEGLLHDSDAHSQNYAQFIVDEYKNPRRRISDLEFGPFHAGAVDLYADVLGRELADTVTVTHNPPGGVTQFSQESVIEGISLRGEAHSNTLRGRWKLSPKQTSTFS